MTGGSADRCCDIRVCPKAANADKHKDKLSEGQLALLLSNNRCIVETIELGQHDGRHYIAMEYIGGRDLTQVLRRCQETGQRIPVPHAVYIAARIAEGLHFAHTLVALRTGRTLDWLDSSVGQRESSYRDLVAGLGTAYAKAAEALAAQRLARQGQARRMDDEIAVDAAEDEDLRGGHRVSKSKKPLGGPRGSREARGRSANHQR